MKRKIWRLVPCLLALLSLASPAMAHGNNHSPSTLELPSGFNPEGIASGPGNTVFVGSINSGAVYRANVLTGEGTVVVEPSEGRVAIGLEWDRRSDLLYVAGGPTGKVFVYDASTGASVAEIVATTEATTFVNDVVVARDAVYFTDSYRPVLYRLSLGRRGRLPVAASLDELPLTGDFEFVSDQFNTNGIETTPNGQHLLIISSVLGVIYRVDPETGISEALDLNGATLVNGDGLLRSGRTLFVVQNFDNQIVAIRLDADASHGTVKRTLTNEAFDVPTTVARVGRSLYAVNARFSTEVTPETEYQVVRVPLSPRHH